MPIAKKMALFVCIGLWCMVSTVLADNRTATVLPDSILTEDHVYRYMLTDAVKARRVMKELRDRKLYPKWDLDYVEGDLYYNTGHSRKALEFYAAAMESETARGNDTLYMDLLHREISCYDRLHDETEKTRCVEELLKRARRCGNEAMQSVALFNMGKSVYYQGNKDEGYRLMRRAVTLMERTDYRLKYDNLRYNYNTLATFYEQDGRNAEVLRTLSAWESLLGKSTGGEKEVDGLDLKDRKDICAHRAVALSRMGRKEEAERYYRRFRALDKEIGYDAYLVMPYLFDTKQYGEIFRINLPRERFLREQGDTVNYYMASIKKQLGLAYREVGDYRRSSLCFEQLAVLRDSLKARQQRSHALELAAVYKAHEQESQIQRQKQENALTRFIAISLSVLLLLVVCFSAFLYLQYRTIRRRNKSLVKNAEETLAVKRKLLEKTEECLGLRQRLEAFSRKPEPVREPVAEEESARLLEADDGKWTEADHILFDRITSEIKTRRLFLRNLSRKDLLKDFPVPANRFAGLFKHFARQTFTDYMQNLRLDYAGELFIAHPDWSVEAVIKECGMSKSVFYSRFSQKYGVSPEAFRKSAEENP